MDIYFTIKKKEAVGSLSGSFFATKQTTNDNITKTNHVIMAISSFFCKVTFFYGN